MGTTSSGPGPASRIEVERVGERMRVRSTSGLLRAQQTHGPPGRARVVLLAASALLLGGDEVDLVVRVGPGAALDLAEVAGTVAYPGPPARWSVRLELADGADVRFAGLPFVVAAGATVDRSLTVDLGVGAGLVVRDTVVLGRFGECGGDGRNRTEVRRSGVPVLVEEQTFDPALRALPGLLGSARILDSLSVLGSGSGDPPPPAAGAATLRLAHDLGWSTRWLGHDLAASPLAGSPLDAPWVDRPETTSYPGS